MLGNADFRTIWYVGSLAEFGRRFELLALSWLILQITEGYFALGLVLVFNNLARPFVSLYAGYIADRFSRRKVLLVSQGITLATTGALLGAMSYDLSLVQPWHVFAAAFVQGLTKAIEDPSRRTAIIDIVGRRRLVNAVSLDVISQNAGKMLGPVAAGVLLDRTGFPGPTRSCWQPMPAIGSSSPGCTSPSRRMAPGSNRWDGACAEQSAGLGAPR